MNVDFNNLRRQTVNAMNDLTRLLNNSIDGETLTVDVSKIQPHMDNLRMLVGSIALVHRDNDPEFIELDIPTIDFNPDPEFENEFQVGESEHERPY